MLFFVYLILNLEQFLLYNQLGKFNLSCVHLTISCVHHPRINLENRYEFQKVT